MKKRVLSIVLAMVMVLSMLPASVLAAGSTATSELKVHYMTEENGKETEVSATEFTAQVFHHWEVRFYLHHSDGTSTLLEDPEALKLPDFMEISEVLSDGWCIIHVTDVGTGKISCTVDSATYYLAAASTLPDLGLYSAQPFNKNTLMEDVLISAASNVFYIALSPEVTANEIRMAAVNTSFGPEIDAANLLKIGSVVLSDDGSYATVTVTDLTAEGHYHFEATMANKAGKESGTWGRSIWIDNDMPRLYFTHFERDDNAWTANLKHPETEWHFVPGSGPVVSFYYGSKSEIQAGKVEPLDMSELTFPAFLQVEKLKDPERTVPEKAYTMRAVRFENANEPTDIVYTAKNATLSTVSQLPNIGFYTKPAASKDAYIWNENPFVVTETNRTVYVCLRDTENFRFDKVNGWREQEARDMFTATLSDNGYVTVTVNDGVIVPNRDYGLEIQYQRKNGNSWENRTEDAWLELKNGQPALMWKHMDWDNENQEWVESTQAELESRFWLNSADEFPVQFYYGTTESYTKVDLSDLTIPTDLLRITTREGVSWIQVCCFEGSGYITYTNPTSGKAVKMRVQITQPDFGLYNSTIPSASSYLKEDVMLSSTSDTFYLVANTADNRKITGITAIRMPHGEGEDVTDHFDVQISADGSYAAIKMKKDSSGNLPIGGRYTILVTQDWGDRYVHFQLIRGDLPQLSTPTDLSWHRQYEWGAETDADYNDRMGSMSFKIGELFQNRCNVEIYSAADNYAFPVLEGGWHFGDMEEHKYLSITDFIYGELESGTYKFRIRAEGDGTKYRSSDWSELSPAFTYTKPSAQLTAPAAADLAWTRGDNRFLATWPLVEQEGEGYYEVNWFYYNEENDRIERSGGSFDIPLEAAGDDKVFYEALHDEILEEHGNVPYYFKVRVIPSDITKYRISPWSDFSPALDVTKVTDDVNDKLETLIPDQSQGETTTVADVQSALENETADLHTAMAADLALSGGASSGTLELIEELEASVSDNVDQEIEAKNSAPQEIKDIAGGITMVGATLNLADKHPESGKTPTVTLVIDEPKEGIVIPEQQHNAVQFSMKLNGAIDKDDQEQSGQQLIVPVVIDMPVPDGINPDFLVVLHKRGDGTIEQILPYIYLNESDNRHHARFVIDSFSDFALLEYKFTFEESAVTKTVGDAPFTLVPSGAPEGCPITYTSSDPSVATVDAATGKVTILKAGTVTITAVAAATDIYPEAEASYTLTVNARTIVPSRPVVPSTPGVNSDATGTKSETTVGQNGIQTTVVTVTALAVSNAAVSGKTVSLPMPAVDVATDSAKAAVVVIDLPAKNTAAKVEIPVSNVTAGTVAVIVHADGTEEVVPYSVPTEKGIALTVSGDVTVKIVDKSRDFSDVPDTHTFSDAVDFASARGIIEGYADGSFGVKGDATSAACVTVIARMMGEDFYGSGSTAKAQAWAEKLGLSKGMDLSGKVTRAQYVLLLWRAAGCPKSSAALDYTDTASIPAEAVEAFAWALELGLIGGYDDGSVRPDAHISRGAMAAIAQRYMIQQ